jgi:hypothetical protein
MTEETKPDEFHGVGGSYIVENGVRRQVEKPTQDHPDGNRPRNSDGTAIVETGAEETKTIPSPSTGEGEGGGAKPAEAGQARKRGVPGIAAASGD